ncbi:MAG: hypothetical protein WED33_13570, partial [Bacteroidia bacterium]
ILAAVMPGCVSHINFRNEGKCLSDDQPGEFSPLSIQGTFLLLSSLFSIWALKSIVMPVSFQADLSDLNCSVRNSKSFLQTFNPFFCYFSHIDT